METYKIIEKELQFLITDVKMIYTHEKKGNQNYYYFSNDFGRFTYYEYRQFGEQEFTILANGSLKTINMFNENPQVYSKFKQEHKGIRFFFKDMRQDYWKMIAEIIKLEIDSTGSLFGLRIK